MIEAVLIYAVTFGGGVFLSFIEKKMSWPERIACGVANAIICGSVLLVAITILTALAGDCPGK